MTLREHTSEKLIKTLQPVSELMEKSAISFRKVDILLHNREVKIRKCCAYFTKYIYYR